MGLAANVGGVRGQPRRPCAHAAGATLIMYELALSHAGVCPAEPMRAPHRKQNWRGAWGKRWLRNRNGNTPNMGHQRCIPNLAWPSNNAGPRSRGAPTTARNVQTNMMHATRVCATSFGSRDDRRTLSVSYKRVQCTKAAKSHATLGRL